MCQLIYTQLGQEVTHLAVSWKFNELRPGDKTREAVQGEFFAITAIRDEVEALVREAIQNSLDASMGGPVRVRFYISGSGEGALSATRASAWLKGAWRHFTAQSNGLDDCPAQSERCPYLVIEDFGTTGLEGDPLVHFARDGESNPFYYFFRAEGRSGKSDSDRGRWGVGKFVFPRSSRLRSFFALSIRNSDKASLLVGQSILKSHWVDDKTFHPDGWYGEQLPEGLMGPLTDSRSHERLRKDFQLVRSGEAGLSVVIPYCAEGMDRAKFVAATVRSYFYPILTGSLEVTVDAPGQSLTLNAASLSRVVGEISEIRDEMASTVGLATWMCSQASGSLIRLVEPTHDKAARWSVDLMPEEIRTDLRQKLDHGDAVMLRVPLKVRNRDSLVQSSYFDIALKREEGATERPLFVREGIIISDARAPRCRGYRALVVIDDKPLATLLGDAENPSHTQWQSDSSNFKGRYKFGPSCIQFVTQSVASVLRYIHEQDEAEDATALLDIFYLPAPLDEGSLGSSKKKQAAKKPGSDSPETGTPPEIPPPPPARYRLQRSKGGFTITHGSAQAKHPKLLDIRMAYDRRRGNALKNYSTNDFRMDREPIRMEPPSTGVEILERKENQLLIRPLSPEFTVGVVGFDERRDLYVDVRVRDSHDG
jgi:hypothetical protein